MKSKLDELMMDLVQWQRTTLEYLVQTENEYNEFMSYFEKTKQNSNWRVFDAMKKYRLDRINRLSLSMDEFKNIFNNDSYKGLTLLFQDGMTQSTFKRIQDRIKEGTTVEMLFKYHLFYPEEYLFRIAVMKITEESFENIRVEGDSEPYREVMDVTIDDIEEYNGISLSNHKIRDISVQRMVRDTKLATKIKILYQNCCQVCRSRIRSTNGYISEAHHIRPYNKTHRGDDAFHNLIVLCPNCHARFDDFFYAINPETKLIHCLDINDENHLREPYMVAGHIFSHEYLSFAWGIFCELNNDTICK